ncbi:type IVB secretion system protein IcmH/DotU [Rubellimicrobium arenae]|uniref:type IVB secretion system protein IcmH/DotU n=1 Tax=Rubellimicrobium arenae TaxID=2817372 RepID=UPI001B3152EA|nr:type IVB secretion system protein IcmH/DotU [Rubellimicrobium arenae]
MTDADDPFGLMNDAGRTRIRPSGRRAEPVRSENRPEPASARSQPRRTGAVSVRHPRAHPNPLVASFAPLLEIAPELEGAAPPESAETLRVRLLANLIEARDAAVSRGVPLSRADQAAWFVAALLDDLAINTPWGGQSDWPRRPLVVELAGEVDPGTRFFERLADLQRYAERDRDLLELGYMCLCLGFRGRFRVDARQGQAALLQTRAALARLLRSPDAMRSALSPRWEGVDVPDVPRRFAVPLWTIGLGTLAVVTAIYVGLGMRLSEKGEQLYALARLIPPPEPAGIYRPIRQTDPVSEPVEAALPVEPVVLELLPQFQAAAPADTGPALTGHDDVGLAVLVVRGSSPEVFRSARAEVNDVYRPLFASIARTILDNAEVIGRVTVIGHTDSVPVQASNPFASNQGLSEARAQTIARLLAEAGVPYELLQAEGRADSEPVADNATPEGRAQNRRVEIRIEKRL